jgi:hypothetical protein
MINIVTLLSDLSRMVEKDVKYLADLVHVVLNLFEPPTFQISKCSAIDSSLGEKIDKGQKRSSSIIVIQIMKN